MSLIKGGAVFIGLIISTFLFGAAMLFLFAGFGDVGSQGAQSLSSEVLQWLTFLCPLVLLALMIELARGKEVNKFLLSILFLIVILLMAYPFQLYGFYVNEVGAVVPKSILQNLVLLWF